MNHNLVNMMLDRIQDEEDSILQHRPVDRQRSGVAALASALARTQQDAATDGG